MYNLLLIKAITKVLFTNERFELRAWSNRNYKANFYHCNRMYIVWTISILYLKIKFSIFRVCTDLTWVYHYFRIAIFVSLHHRKLFQFQQEIRQTLLLDNSGIIFFKNSKEYSHLYAFKKNLLFYFLGPA